MKTAKYLLVLAAGVVFGIVLRGGGKPRSHVTIPDAITVMVPTPERNWYVRYTVVGHHRYEEDGDGAGFRCTSSGVTWGPNITPVNIYLDGEQIVLACTSTDYKRHTEPPAP